MPAAQRIHLQRCHQSRPQCQKVIGKWRALYQDQSPTPLPAIVPVNVAPKGQAGVIGVHQAAIGRANHNGEKMALRFQGVRPVCTRADAVSRINAIWLASEPMELRFSLCQIAWQPSTDSAFAGWQVVCTQGDAPGRIVRQGDQMELHAEQPQALGGDRPWQRHWSDRQILTK